MSLALRAAAAPAVLQQSYARARRQVQCEACPLDAPRDPSRRNLLAAGVVVGMGALAPGSARAEPPVPADAPAGFPEPSAPQPPTPVLGPLAPDASAPSTTEPPAAAPGAEGEPTAEGGASRIPLSQEGLSQEAARKLEEEEEARKSARRGRRGRIRELEEARAELADREAALLEKEAALLESEQTLMVLRQELEIERKLRALLAKEREKAEEQAALALGLCSGGGMLP